MMSLMFSSTARHMPWASVVVMLVLQRAAQSQQRARHALARRALVDAAGSGHFFEGEVGAKTQQQRVAIARFYLPEQGPGSLRAPQGGRWLLERGLRPPLVAALVPASPPLFLVLQTLVARDTQQPGAQRAVAPILAERLVRRQQRLLRDVVGVDLRAQHGHAQAPDARAMPVHAERQGSLRFTPRQC